MLSLVWLERKMKNKKGMILMENVIFIIIVVLFFGILFAFVYKSTSSVSLVEEKGAKNIALMIDAANSGTEMLININDLIEKKKDDYSGHIVIIENDKNLVTVKSSGKSGFSYSYFNDKEIDYQIQEGGFLKITVNE